MVTVFALILSVFGKAISNRPSRSVYDNIELLKKYEDNLYKDPLLTKNKAAGATMQVYRSISCAILGAGCEDRTVGFNNSILGSATNAALYPLTHPPASGILETYDTIAKAGLVPQTQAAEGIGFSALRGFRNIWLLFRNLAFALLVLVIVAIAFMMMFRMKMSAQTSISIESALPKIVITMLLITFSYAIAGFLIDVMYVVMGVMVSVLCGGTDNTYCKGNEVFATYATGGPMQIWLSFFPYVPTSSGDGVLSTITGFMYGVGNLSGLSTVFGLADNILNILPGPITSFVYLASFFANMFIMSYILSIYRGTGLGEALSGVTAFTFSFGSLPNVLTSLLFAIPMWTLLAQILPRLIMGILIFMTIIGLFFRIYFMLLFAYLRILLLIIFAPAYILLEAIPGNNAFSSWFKSIFAELMTFPIVVGLFISGSLIVNNFLVPGDATSHVWAPPFLGGVDQGSFLMIVGLGILFLVPDLTNQAKAYLGAGKGGSKFGLGMFFAGAGAGVAGASMLTGRGLGLLKILPGGLGEKAANSVGSFFKPKFHPYMQPFRAQPKVLEPSELENIRAKYGLKPKDSNFKLSRADSKSMNEEIQALTAQKEEEAKQRLRTEQQEAQAAAMAAAMARANQGLVNAAATGTTPSTTPPSPAPGATPNQPPANNPNNPPGGQSGSGTTGTP